MRVLVLVVSGVLVGAACSQIPGFGGPSPSVAASPSVQLDAEVPMPSGFPADVPVYPKARLTAAAFFNSAGQVAWGMEWETTDDPAKVQAYYLKEFNQGDWKLMIYSAPPPGAFLAGTFARKSNSHSTGTIAVNAAHGVTAIALSFLSSS